MLPSRGQVKAMGLWRLPVAHSVFASIVNSFSELAISISLLVPPVPERLPCWWLYLVSKSIPCIYSWFWILSTGELHFIPSSPDSFVNLPREGGVAYAAQESWVQNETIRVRHNIPLDCRGPFVPRKISFLEVLSMKNDTKRVSHTFTLSNVVLASEQSSINVLWNATSPCSKLVIGLRSEKKDSPSGS